MATTKKAAATTQKKTSKVKELKDIYVVDLEVDEYDRELIVLVLEIAKGESIKQKLQSLGYNFNYHTCQDLDEDEEDEYEGEDRNRPLTVEVTRVVKVGEGTITASANTHRYASIGYGKNSKGVHISQTVDCNEWDSKFLKCGKGGTQILQW